MKRTPGFRAQQLMRLSRASVFLLRTVGPYDPVPAALSSTQLAAVGLVMVPPQGILREHSSRSIKQSRKPVSLKEQCHDYPFSYPSPYDL